ncbi:MAG: YgjV family protein [Leptospiraceae bacterium]|nr:YgjV family protein [Leptospiraceae bacterium]MCP5497226.1 YgjV family protein [Leptospiraceae bacterium]
MLIQLIGFIALLFVILSFQKNKRNEILFFIVIAQVLFAIHFGLLGAYTAMSANIIAVFRGIVYIKRKERIFLYIFILLFLISGYVTWEGYRSILPVVAMVVETIGFWLHNTKYIRIINLIPRPMWLSYNIMAGSIAGIVCEFFVLGSLIVGMMRFDRKTPSHSP